jgi:hypothetical protein
VSPPESFSWEEREGFNIYPPHLPKVFIQSTCRKDMRNNETLSLRTTWKNLENIMLTEISQTQKDKQHWISFTCGV